MTPAENLGPDAEFIGAGDDVVVIQGGRITVRGVLVDVDENGDAIVKTVTGRWVPAHYDDLAHPDSPLAARAEA
jgi:ribosomal protein L24